MQRGDVYDADLDPTVSSEQAGTRPVVIVSRNAINNNSSAVLGVPFTTFRSGRRLYPSQVIIRTPEGGLSVDSVALCEQVRILSKLQLRRYRGALTARTLVQIDRALLMALDLSGQA